MTVHAGRWRSPSRPPSRPVQASPQRRRSSDRVGLLVSARPQLITGTMARVAPSSGCGRAIRCRRAGPISALPGRSAPPPVHAASVDRVLAASVGLAQKPRSPLRAAGRESTAPGRQSTTAPAHVRVAESVVQRALKEELINSSYSRRIYSAGGRRAERFTIPKKGFVFDNLKFTLRTFYIDCAWKGNHRIGKTGDHSHDLETEIYFILYNKFMQITTGRVRGCAMDVFMYLEELIPHLLSPLYRV